MSILRKPFERPFELSINEVGDSVKLSLSIPKTLSGVFRARGAWVWQHDIVDAAEAGDGFRVDSALNSGRLADRSP